MKMPAMNFVKEKLGVLLVFLAMVVLLVLAYFSLKTPGEKEFAQLCIDMAKDFKIALLTLITGGAGYLVGAGSGRHDSPPSIVSDPNSEAPEKGA
jgi:hypothetical protein